MQKQTMLSLILSLGFFATAGFANSEFECDYKNNKKNFPTVTDHFTIKEGETRVLDADGFYHRYLFAQSMRRDNSKEFVFIGQLEKPQMTDMQYMFPMKADSDISIEFFYTHNGDEYDSIALNCKKLHD